MRSKAGIIVSVVLAIVAVLMVNAYISSRESELLQLSEMKDVLVANRDIPANLVIDEQIIERIQVPSKYVQPKAISDVKEVVGRVAAVPIAQGTQIVGPQLEDAGRTALAYEVPRGRRAVTLAISDVTGVGGLIRPGNFVDIIGTFNFGRPTSVQGGAMQYADERTETRTLMQNVFVVAVNQEHRRERPAPRRPVLPEELPEEPEPPEARSVNNVTVLVAPAQVQELILAQEIGQLTLALRSNLDAGQVVDLGVLDPFGLLKVPIPVKPRQRPAWREMRGPSIF